MSSDGYDFSKLTNQWVGTDFNVYRDFFYEDGVPKLGYVVDWWKTVVNLYFKRFNITHEQGVFFWLDLLDAVMRSTKHEVLLSDSFMLWLYGCLHRFVRDNRRYYMPPKPRENIRVY